MTKGGPVEVTSRDGMEWRQDEQVIIAKGDAKAVRGTVTVTADQLIAHYRKKAAAGPAPCRGPRRPGRCDARRAGRHARHRQQRDLPAGGGGQRPHLHRNRPGLRRPGRLRHRPVGAGDDRARPAHHHAAADHVGARHHGILVAEAHGGRPRQCRGQHQRRPPAVGRRAGGLHRGPERRAGRPRPVQKVAARPPSPGPTRWPMPAASCSAWTRSAMSRSAPRRRSSTPTRASTSRIPASPGWPATSTSRAGRTSSTATRP